MRICYNTVNIVDLHNLTARPLKVKGEEQLEARRSHSCVLMGRYMLVFGGLNTRREMLKDLAYLDLKEVRWYHKEYTIESATVSHEL